MDEALAAQLLGAIESVNGDVRTVNGKVDKSFGVTRDIQVSVGRLDERMLAHEESHKIAAETRHATCPNSSTVNQLVHDQNALAGMMRTLTGRVDDLEDAACEDDAEAKVEAAVEGERMKVLRWAWDNSTNIAGAVFIAYLIGRFVTKQ